MFPQEKNTNKSKNHKYSNFKLLSMNKCASGRLNSNSVVQYFLSLCLSYYLVLTKCSFMHWFYFNFPLNYTLGIRRESQRHREKKYVCIVGNIWLFQIIYNPEDWLCFRLEVWHYSLVPEHYTLYLWRKISAMKDMCLPLKGKWQFIK